MEDKIYPPNFPYLSCLLSKTFGFNANDYITGYVTLFKIDKYGNPIFKYDQNAINIMWRDVTYIMYHTDKKKWVYYDSIDFFSMYYFDKPDDPLDVIDVSEFPNPKGCVARGLFQTFEKIKNVCKFIQTGEEKKYKSFMRNLILCNKKCKSVPNLPLEIFFLIMTFLRVAEIDGKTFYSPIQVGWDNYGK